MNLVYENPSIPLRVVLVNAVDDVMAMIAIKALRGVIFGTYQLVDLTLLVYENDLDKALELKWNLEAAAFPCNNSIMVTSKLPRLTDADMFIVVTKFSNPNHFEIKKVHEEHYFDSLYLILKFALHLENPSPASETILQNKIIKNEIEKPNRRPVIITDGLVALDIIKTFSNNLPDDIFFCPTPMSSVSRSILGDHLKVQCSDLNTIYVWGANDIVFHVDIEKPVYLLEKSTRRRPCEWDVMANRDLADLNMDSSQFNAAWLKKDFLEKVGVKLSHHSRGSIYSGAKISNSLKQIWKTRAMKPVPINKCNLGVISDGSLGTIKGLPYFLPMVFTGDTYRVNEHLKEDIHLKQEIKRINKTALESHQKLKRFCKKFLKKYVIKQDFTPSSEDVAESTTATTAGPLFPNARDED